jgi:hypothetical protein
LNLWRGCVKNAHQGLESGMDMAGMHRVFVGLAVASQKGGRRVALWMGLLVVPAYEVFQLCMLFVCLTWVGPAALDNEVEAMLVAG